MVRFTQHAIERFRERWVPQFSYARARRELIILSALAVPMRDKTHGGQERHLIDDGTSRIVLVGKRDRGELIVVTVLPEEQAEV